MARGKVRADNRADTRGGGFTGLPHVVQDSAAYRHLSLWGRAVLFEVLRRSNGYNNGSIAVSQRELADALSTTNYRKVGTAVAELMQHGLLDVTVEGVWKERQARQYRLTFISTGNHNHYAPATNDYLRWSPGDKSGADDVSAGEGRSADDASSASEKPADDVSARIAAHRRKSAIPENQSADDASSLICKPYPPVAERVARGGICTRRKPPSSIGPSVDASLEDITAAVRTALCTRHASRGLVGLYALASSAGIDGNRVVAFIKGRDPLSGPTVLRLKRALAADERAAEGAFRAG